MLAGRCEPLTYLTRKGIPFEWWDDVCSNAFKSIKAYLTKAPILVAPIHGNPLHLYFSAQERCKENALYYLSKMMTPNEVKYLSIEKLCLVLIFSIQKLKHYFQVYTMYLISKENPIKYVMTKPVLSDRLAMWYLQPQQFEIVYVSQKAVKGQVVADFLAKHPLPAEWGLTDDLLDEDVFLIEILPSWKMYFVGAAHQDRASAGVVFVTSEDDILPYSFTLTEKCLNNMAEYQALILGLEIVVDIKQLQLRIYRDSKLIVNQIIDYNVKKLELLPYCKYAKLMIDWLGYLTSTLCFSSPETQISICQSWVIPPAFEDDDDEIEQQEKHETYVVSITKNEREDWRQRSDVQRRSPRFVYYKHTIYRRSFEGVLLRCLGDEEAMQSLEETHSGIYYIHQPPEPLHLFVAPWLFDAWGLNIVGPLPKSSSGHVFILSATDYFSKWDEAIVLKKVEKEMWSTSFVVILYSVMEFQGIFITDNGKHFCNSSMTKLCEKFDYKRYYSSMYYAAANGLAEEFNKTLCNLLKKVIDKSKRDWHLKIEEALWAYGTTFRTPTQAISYALIYVVEAVLPLEHQIPSFENCCLKRAYRGRKYSPLPRGIRCA
ncbi:hypothetical protein M9H77_12540 [Catharanthus roseus]|uniref:Uncharacterized protein n=1 Tax=Catharanthus roseus TaxID=4058 RepID=A0ACC0BHT4_CATRO|nr:hypothetical protein M9H77_12540 [Catharanthus roseus]